jgi:hypothetical protein
MTDQKTDHKIARQHGRALAGGLLLALAAAGLAAFPGPSDNAFAQSAEGAQSQVPSGFLVAETGQRFDRLQDAVNAIGAGRGTIMIGPGNYNQCAVQTAGRIAYRGVQAGSAILRGAACEGKAALVLRGEGAFVEGLVFANIRVADKNGSGIRLEAGDLTVTQSWFRDSEQGILTGAGSGMSIRVDKSTFTRLGTCEGAGGCAHSIYVGDIAEAVVTASRFEEGRGGHYLKSRAARNVANGNSFDDSAGAGTNYMIDYPAGGVGEVRGNWFVQGKDKENYSAFIAVAAEGARHSSDGFTVAGNDARLVPGLRRSTAFVADWSGDNLVIEGNQLGTGLKRFERR